MLQRSVKSLHEYLADEGVINEGVQKIDYQQLIFHQTLGKQLNNLTNNFNVSLIKKRIVMMTKSRSKTVARMKILRGIGSGCDKEALRVIYLMKPWKPGMDKGKSVRVSFGLPIKFALKEKDKKADNKKK